MEFGLSTFADIGLTPDKSLPSATNQRFKELLREVIAAEELGFDVFAIGEHHRADFVASAPTVILGAAAAITKKIRLSTAVTVLSSDDPVRVYEQFATIDQISDGRAEIMAGRGSFIESFPLFGYDLNDYNELFTEKLSLLQQLNQNEKIAWKGKFRPSFPETGIYPRPFQEHLPIWLAVGGTPESAARAGTLGLPMMLAIIGGTPQRFVPFVNYYKEHAQVSGKFGDFIPLGINSHLYIAETSQQASNESYPHYSQMMNRIGRERGWMPMNRDAFELSRNEQGALMIGSPQQVIDKLLYEHELFGYTRFMAQISIGTLPHSQTMKSMELFATKVIPEVKKAISPTT